MASAKRPAAPGKRDREPDFERQIAVRLPADQLRMIEEIKRRAGGFGTQAQILREALGIGLKSILDRLSGR